MKNAYQQQHARLLAAIIRALPAKIDAVAKEFVAQFYAKAPVADLHRHQASHAAAVALSAYEFMQKRVSNKPQIRVFTPQKKQHGYDGKFTVVELINEDMPFLVDSLTAELSRQGFHIRETIHPIFRVSRDSKGSLTGLSQGKSGKAESLIHFEISPLPEGKKESQVITDLEDVLAHIRVAVSDWQAIADRAQEKIRAFEQKNIATSDDATEAKDFLRWLLDRNFVFLGYADYDFYDAKGKEKLTVIEGSRLGVLKLDDETPRGLEALPPELRHFLLVPQLIEITKSNRRSMVHRAVPMDYVGIKRMGANGKVIGETRFLGLFTSNVYYQSTESIPLLRKKIARVLERSDFDPVSHDGKSLKAILEFLPRDEIFQMSDDDLFETSMGILALEAKPGVRLFVRKDAFERFIGAMVFVPRERFSTELRYQIQELIEKAFRGVVYSFSTQITEAQLARLHLIVKTQPGSIPEVDLAALEQEIAKRAYLWADLLAEALRSRHDDQKAERLFRSYASAFPQGYINRYDSAAAVYDVDKIETALASGELALEFFRAKNQDAQHLSLKIYNPNEEIALSDILPILENAGFRAIEEHPFLVTPASGARVWIRDFKLQIVGASLDLPQVKNLLEDALLGVWRKQMENDRFNTLVLKAGLSSRHITMLRAYSKYFKQTGFTYSQSAVEQALINHPDITKQIVALFIARFEPIYKDREVKQEALKAAIEAQLADVTNAAEDRILRRYVDIITATLRTNYFQDGKPVLSFKFDSAQVPDLPLPRPFVEIFVYSPRVEGIHLRGGRVARGGLRWSDRPEDFRTEILGLMKAQMVKNSVIVPVGSKGGFVLKTPTTTREATMAEGIACYTLYLQGLLDITDNIVAGKMIAPKQTIRYDGDDPYLVVAADKGTASFSDIANGVSAQYQFWLGDAFASGGSAGYDHKKMAITARGAWVSVARHFHEMGVDIETREFTAVGIGDMAGDVFGNGMLLSKNLRLLAAFNHQHIFLDPSPDAKASFKERERLFELPRSSWKDYDTKLLSKGGGIFERSAKSIDLSKEAQTALGFFKNKVTPDELIRAILLAPVDLLWNGGIGTYVKSEDESHEQVGDRANNSVRVNGKELRCKLVGEGGNLGFTQKGRIEYARAGGRINTDAIDNSAGVDCSDHEVNIKIAFAGEIGKGTLTMAKRDKLLASMTDEVAALVLKDNILQTQALTVAQQQGAIMLDSQLRLIHTLERKGELDRSVEFLPTDKQFGEMKAASRGLTRPSLAVLLAYSKMALFKEIIDSTLPDEAYFEADLLRYFPKAMQGEFAAAIKRHPLKREIIATVMTNSLVNRAGITFFFDIADDIGATARDVASAYAVARDAFGLRALWKDIEQASHVNVATQVEMYSQAQQFLERVTVWLLRNLPAPLDINSVIKEIVPEIAEIEKHQSFMRSDTIKRAADKQLEKLLQQGVPQALAEKIALLELKASACDIISLAHQTGLAIKDAGKVYFAVGARVRLGWLRRLAEKIITTSHWERLGVGAMINDLYDEQRRLTLKVIENRHSVEDWATKEAASFTRFERLVSDLKATETPDIPKLMVALKHIRAL